MIQEMNKMGGYQYSKSFYSVDFEINSYGDYSCQISALWLQNCGRR